MHIKFAAKRTRPQLTNSTQNSTNTPKNNQKQTTTKNKTMITPNQQTKTHTTRDKLQTQQQLQPAKHKVWTRNQYIS